MFFLSTRNKHLPEAKNRTILIIGGTGVLGTAFLSQKPEDAFIINISKEGNIPTRMGLSIRHDICKNPEKLIYKIARIVPMIDVLITMAYDHSFSSVENLQHDTFLREVELDTYLPMKLSVVCAERFWSKEDRQINIKKGRKVIHISSGAAFGKTSRPELASYSGAKAALNIMTEYLHDYLYSSVGVSAHIVAPGALKEKDILQEAVDVLWGLEKAPATKYTITKVF